MLYIYKGKSEKLSVSFFKSKAQFKIQSNEEIKLKQLSCKNFTTVNYSMLSQSP